MSKRPNSASPTPPTLTDEPVCQLEPKSKLFKPTFTSPIQLHITKHSSLDTYIQKVLDLVKKDTQLKLSLQSRDTYIPKLVSLVETLKFMEGYQVEMELELLEERKEDKQVQGKGKLMEKLVSVLKVEMVLNKKQ